MGLFVGFVLLMLCFNHRCSSSSKERSLDCFNYCVGVDEGIRWGQRREKRRTLGSLAVSDTVRDGVTLAGSSVLLLRNIRADCGEVFECRAGTHPWYRRRSQPSKYIFGGPDFKEGKKERRVVV